MSDTNEAVSTQEQEPVEKEAKKGFRQAPKQTKKQVLEQEIRGLQIAVRMMQMMLQQLVNNFTNMDRDIKLISTSLTELQYRTIAMVNTNVFDKDQLQQLGNEFRLKDFEEMSAKDDADKKLVDELEITASSIVTITTTVLGSAAEGIFRSKLKVSECGSPSLMQALIGKKVSDRVTTMINDKEHEVEILAIKKEPEVPATVEPTTAPETTTVQ